MKNQIKILIFLLTYLAGVFCAYQAGIDHKPKPTTRERLQTAFDSGRHFSDGWKACEDLFQIKFTNGTWKCLRFESGVPDGWHPIVTSADENFNYEEKP